MSDTLTDGMLAVAILVLATATYAVWHGAPWIPSRRGERDALFKAAGMKDGDELHDLGSGGGAVIFDAARRYPASRVVGVEVFILPYLLSRLRKLISGRKYANVRIRYGDFYRHDISSADIVFTFQIPKAYGRLAKKFAECKNDCTVVVEAWPFNELEPLRAVKEGRHLTMYAYRGRQFRREAGSRRREAE
ncbi:MAG: class I SAM-dependent methyltransferase [Patescibacteria group bacterium]|nr:class I SAM-dependent methyltransferase [Patescibacteria group bacterium]